MREDVLVAVVLVVTLIIIFLSGRTSVKPQNHLKAYAVGLLLVSVPSFLLLAWQASLGNISDDGSMGLILTLLILLIAGPFIGLYFWGLVKKAVADKQLKVIFPTIGVGLFAGAALIYLVNTSNSFGRFCAIFALASLVIIIFSKLIFTLRFWAFQILGLLVALTIVAINSLWGSKDYGLILAWVLFSISFASVFLIVYNWFDSKLRLKREVNVIENTQDSLSDTKIVNETPVSQPLVSEQKAKIGSEKNSKIVENTQLANTNLTEEVVSQEITQPINLKPASPIEDPMPELPKPNVVVNNNANQNAKSLSSNLEPIVKEKTSSFNVKNNKIDSAKKRPISASYQSAPTKTKSIKLPQIAFSATKLRARIPRFNDKDNLDGLIGDNNDFKMPTFASLATQSSHQSGVEFSVDLRSGETVIKSPSTTGNKQKIVKKANKVTTNLSKPKTKSTRENNLLRRRKNSMVFSSKAKHRQIGDSVAYISGPNKLSYLHFPNDSMTASLLNSFFIKAASQKKEELAKKAKTNSSRSKKTTVKFSPKSSTLTLKKKDKNLAKVKKSKVLSSKNHVSRLKIESKGPSNRSNTKPQFKPSKLTLTKLTEVPINARAVSEIVGKYSPSNTVITDSDKFKNVVEYPSENKFSQILNYKNNLLNKMIFRAGNLTKMPDNNNVLIDRLHRTTRLISSTNHYKKPI